MLARLAANFPQLGGCLLVDEGWAEQVLKFGTGTVGDGREVACPSVGLFVPGVELQVRLSWVTASKQ